MPSLRKRLQELEEPRRPHAPAFLCFDALGQADMHRLEELSSARLAGEWSHVEELQTGDLRLLASIRVSEGVR